MAGTGTLTLKMDGIPLLSGQGLKPEGIDYPYFIFKSYQNYRFDYP